MPRSDFCAQFLIHYNCKTHSIPKPHPTCCQISQEFGFFKREKEWGGQVRSVIREAEAGRSRRQLDAIFNLPLIFCPSPGMFWLPEHWLMHSIYIHSFIPHKQLARACCLSRVLANELQHLKISQALMPAFMQFNFRRWMEGDFNSLSPGVLEEEMIVAGLQMIRFCLNNCIFYFHLYYRNITSLSYLPLPRHLLGEADFKEELLIDQVVW